MQRIPRLVLTIALSLGFTLAAGPAARAQENQPAPAAAAPAAGEAAHGDAHADHGHGGHHAHIGEDVSKAVKDPSEFSPDLAIYTFIVFLVLFFSLQSLAWPKISGALDAREAGIRQAIADAETSRLQAEAFMKEHKGRLEAVEETVKGIVAEGRRDAETTKASILKQAEAEAEAIKNRALAEISRAKDQALSEIFDSLAGQVSAATERVLGSGLSGADHDRLIRDAINQVSSKA